MTIDELKGTLGSATPPQGLAPALVALWHDARGEWQAAHGLAQNVDNDDGSWVHAYLHRKEGDSTNAEYWYRRAGRPAATGPLQDEWDQIVTTLLARP